MCRPLGATTSGTRAIPSEIGEPEHLFDPVNAGRVRQAAAIDQSFETAVEILFDGPDANAGRP